MWTWSTDKVYWKQRLSHLVLYQVWESAFSKLCCRQTVHYLVNMAWFHLLVVASSCTPYQSSPSTLTTVDDWPYFQAMWVQYEVVYDIQRTRKILLKYTTVFTTKVASESTNWNYSWSSVGIALRSTATTVSFCFYAAWLVPASPSE